MKSIKIFVKDGHVHEVADLPEDVEAIVLNDNIRDFYRPIYLNRNGITEIHWAQVFDNERNFGWDLHEEPEIVAESLRKDGLVPFALIEYAFSCGTSSQVIVANKMLFRTENFKEKERFSLIRNLIKRFYPALEHPDFKMKLEEPKYITQQEWDDGLKVASKVFFDTDLKPFAALININEDGA